MAERYPNKEQPNPSGPYTRWTNFGYEGWGWIDYDTIEEALTANQSGATFVITKPVRYRVVEQAETFRERDEGMPPMTPGAAAPLDLRTAEEIQAERLAGKAAKG